MKTKKQLNSRGIKRHHDRRRAHGTNLFIGSFPKPVSFVTPAEIQAIQSHFHQEIDDLLSDRAVERLLQQRRDLE